MESLYVIVSMLIIFVVALITVTIKVSGISFNEDTQESY